MCLYVYFKTFRFFVKYFYNSLSMLFNVIKLAICRHDNGEGHDTNSRKQEENTVRTNQQEQHAPENAIYDDSAAQQQSQQNQYEVRGADTDPLAATAGMRYKASIKELEYRNQTSLL